MKKCKECGAPLEEDELFCGECGAKVESEAGEPQTEKEVEEEEEPEEEESDEEDGSDEADAEEEPKPVQKKPAAKKTSTRRKSSGSGRKKSTSKSDNKKKQEENDDTAAVSVIAITSLVLMAIALKVLGNDHTIIAGILTYLALGMSLGTAMPDSKKTRPLLFLSLFAWSGISLYLADNDHPVFAWSCLLALACTTGGLSNIKKKLAIVPLVVTLGVAVALFVLF